MRLCVLGGDARMQGALSAAERAGWKTEQITEEGGMPSGEAYADAVMLPWPQSFRGGFLVGSAMSREQVLAQIPPCGTLLCGADALNVCAEKAGRVCTPEKDEAFLLANAALTAEGAVARAMGVMGRALCGSTCVVTGFGRIGRALTVRLTAMEAFVIVCARSEAQMCAAHQLGAHPVPLQEIASACAQADAVMNTVPAHVLHEAALSRLRKGVPVIELASAPHGMDTAMAERLGVRVLMEGGLPGRYAPAQAGEALFGALCRAMAEGEASGKKEDQAKGREEKSKAEDRKKGAERGGSSNA